MEPIEFLQSDKVRRYLSEHRDTDPIDVILNPPKEWSKAQSKLVADQLISRRKAKTKLPGWVAQKGTIFPPPLSVEQSSSEEAAAYKAGIISGKHLIDLTGGMGVDTLALSHGFEYITYVERDSWLCALFLHNSVLLGEKNIEVKNSTAEEVLENFKGKATFFIDPARRDALQRKVFRFADCSPSLASLLPLLEEKADSVLVKAAPLIDISQGLAELDHVAEIHVLSIKNECKEVLFLMDFTRELPDPEIICTNLADSKAEIFRFQLSKEKKIQVDFDEVSDYLYDPNASILKAGAFKSITSKYPVRKLGVNTHLYTSDQLIQDFPGRIFKVFNHSPDKAELKKLKQANVITKNYPLKPEELKKKYKLKDGGNYFLIGFRDMRNKPKLVLAKSK